MALSLNLYLRNALHQKLRLFAPSRNIHITHVKNLYSPSSLGIDKFLQNRKRVNERFTSYSEKFRSKMAAFVADQENMIFTEDLKNMVHMAEPTDLDLILKMIKKFNSNEEMRFGSFVFGPVVMRMFHFLDAPTEALQCFYDKANINFFDQQVSYQILLDLLYNHNRYDDMFKVFETVQEKQLNMTKYPKYSTVLIFAACYKQNTPESFHYATHLWSEMNKVGNIPLRRAATLFAGLALKQGAPHIALEALSTQRPYYVTVRNIKAVALADLGRADDALFLLRSVIDIDSPTNDQKHTFFEDTLSKVRSVIEKSNKSDMRKDFENIEQALRERSLIDSQDLDSHLNSDIKVYPSNSKDNFNNQPQGNRKMKFAHRGRNTTF